MNRGRRGDEIFTGVKDCSAFIDLLKEIVDVYNVKVSAYCLMSNHYHLLVKTPDANLSRAMRHLNGVYTQRYNRNHYCDGQLFRGRYKAILIEADSYLLELLRYIHRNPLEANLVDSLQKYNGSSHKGYLSKAKKWDWLYKGFPLSLFSKDHLQSIRLYKQFVTREIPDEINKILGGKKLPPVLGSEKFIDKIKSKICVLLIKSLMKYLKPRYWPLIRKKYWELSQNLIRYEGMILLGPEEDVSMSHGMLVSILRGV